MRPLSKFGPHRISFAISIDVWSLDCVLEETTMLVLYFTVLLLHFSAPFQRSFPIPWTSDAAAICALLHGFISQLSHYIFSHDSHHGNLLIMSFFLWISCHFSECSSWGIVSLWLLACGSHAIPHEVSANFFPRVEIINISLHSSI